MIWTCFFKKARSFKKQDGQKLYFSKRRNALYSLYLEQHHFAFLTFPILHFMHLCVEKWKHYQYMWHNLEPYALNIQFVTI